MVPVAIKNTLHTLVVLLLGSSPASVSTTINTMNVMKLLPHLPSLVVPSSTPFETQVIDYVYLSQDLEQC